jgi:ATP-dependent Clp protease protease subunit
MKITKDNLEIYFEYGVDIANRCIFMTDDVDSDSIGAVIKGLYMMENQNVKHDPIELRICSYGGNVYDMFALHDVTRTLKCPVHTMGMGKVMSAAVLLVACGKKGNRWAGANTSFMVHVPSWDTIDQKMHDHKVDVKEADRLWDSWYNLMQRYSKKESSFWRKLCDKREDVYFDAYQAQEWGIIDHIWDEKGEEME